MTIFGHTAVLAHPGAPSRRPEVPAAAAALADLGYRTVPISAPGTLEGGDILKVITSKHSRKKKM